MKRLPLVAIASCIVLVLFPVAAVAQPRNMTLVDLLNVPRVSSPQLSPDGSQILYVRADADWKTNKRISHIWRVKSDGSGAAQVTSGPDGESSPRWSPDGKWIAFLAKRSGDEAIQIYLMPADGGEGKRLTAHDGAVADITWSPDSTSIVFVSPDPKSTEQKAREKANDDVYAFDEDYQLRHLWKIDVKNEREARITQGDYTISSYELSRDGKRIAHHRAPNPLFGYSDRGEVWVMDADGRNAAQITKNTIPESSATLSPDGTELVFVANANERFETYYNDNIFLVPAGGGAARDLTKEFPYEMSSVAWSKDGKSLYFVANMGVHSELFQLDLTTKEPRQLTKGNHSIGNWSYVPELDRQVFTLDDATNPGDIWVQTGAGAPTRVTHVFDYLARDFRLPRLERVTWKGADGADVEGLLTYPLDYKEGVRCPLIVQTHGGPQSSDKFGFTSWSEYQTVLAARGYCVLQPNYRGSTGYGDAFLRDMVGSYFKNSHLDVMAGVDHVIKMGVADGDRMGKMGWSAGGHMTNKIITFTSRFKAASSGAGAANWVSMYAQSDVRTYRTPWFGGTPWQKNAPIDLYWDHSPLKYVSNVTTPTIFLVGKEDPRVPMPQSVEMYRALKSNGVPTHLYVAPREPHGWQELRHELFKMNVELDWFERWVTKRPYEWEKAPGEEDSNKTTQ
ncbi:MAG: S9 family peptidase [Acidobacteria bacterium]|nr:S9 family peptidase [Acidobacteriota bacterium]